MTWRPMWALPRGRHRGVMTNKPNASTILLLPLLAVVILLAACSSSAEVDTGSPATTEVPKAQQDPPDQPATAEPAIAPETTGAPDAQTPTDLEWSDCGSLQCATVDVPIDYTDPDSETIAIAINKREANSVDERIGFLLTNPGGPGETGLDFVEQAEGFYPPDVLDRFDIVGFDPRGIGKSEPTLSCGTDAEQDAIVDAFDGDPTDPLSPELLATGEALIQLCFANTGPAFSRVHAEYIARDMDVIRNALGAEQISFHGLSWGAHIGTWYASLFPDRTRAMVIDAALNPTQVGHTRVEMQMAYDGLLRQAIEACDESCPIYNDGDPVGYYLGAIEKFDLVAEALGDNGNLFGTLLGPVYGADLYPSLWNALWELGENDNPMPFVELGSSGDSGEPTADQVATFEKHQWANRSANCVDEFVLHPQVTREYLLTEEVEISQPLVDAAQQSIIDANDVDAEETSLPIDFCAILQPHAPAPFTGAFDGGDVAIIVVANAFEGPIPYGQSKTLATEVLSNGYLIDVLGSTGHVVYPSNDCVVEIVNAHLINLELPASVETTCDEQNSSEITPTREMMSSICREIVAEEVPVVLTDEQVSSICSTTLDRAVAERGEAVFDDDEYLSALLEEVVEEQLGAQD